VALFRSWLIEHFGPRKQSEDPQLRLAVSNELRLAASND
jgi:hypothetical protein